MKTREITDRILQLKKEKRAVILAHYYARPEIQDVADYLGDSLGLSQAAGNTDADIIVFCGVQFMAETAAIISPQKKVLVPVWGAGCSLAESIRGEDLKQWKAAHPDSIVVSYVNTTAEVKAWTDICCTSANALKVVESLPADKEILFVPDKNLGAWIKKKTGRELTLWAGDCCVHNPVSAEMVLEKSREYPDADILIHPECACSSDERILGLPQAFLYSTAGMVKHAAQSAKRRFIIATETGTLHKLGKDNPGKEFIPIHPQTICGEMKKGNVLVIDTLASSKTINSDGFATAEKVAQGLGRLAFECLDKVDYSVFVIGGDTLLCFLKNFGKLEMEPVCEIRKGVVLSYLHHGGKLMTLMSKSGGFGSVELIAELLNERKINKEDMV